MLKAEACLMEMGIGSTPTGASFEPICSRPEPLNHQRRLHMGSIRCRVVPIRPMLDAPALPFPEGMVRPIPLILLEKLNMCLRRTAVVDTA